MADAFEALNGSTGNRQIIFWLLYFSPTTVQGKGNWFHGI